MVSKDILVLGLFLCIYTPGICMGSKLAFICTHTIDRINFDCSASELAIPLSNVKVYSRSQTCTFTEPNGTTTTFVNARTNCCGINDTVVRETDPVIDLGAFDSCINSKDCTSFDGPWDFGGTDEEFLTMEYKCIKKTAMVSSSGSGTVSGNAAYLFIPSPQITTDSLSVVSCSTDLDITIIYVFISNAGTHFTFTSNKGEAVGFSSANSGFIQRNVFFNDSATLNLTLEFASNPSAADYLLMEVTTKSSSLGYRWSTTMSLDCKSSAEGTSSSIKGWVIAIIVVAVLLCVGLV